MAIARAQITGVVLAGGRGTRMGGLDKGLQTLRGEPLVAHALARLRPQVGPLMISANRHHDRYARFGVPVWADSLPDHPGPLAGFLAALEHGDTPWVMTVPCDAPFFPADLVARLAQALDSQAAEIAWPSCAEHAGAGPDTGRWRAQPVFCLLRRALAADLRAWLLAGGRQVGTWTARHPHAVVPFDDAGAFDNLNTPAQLQALQA